MDETVKTALTSNNYNALSDVAKTKITQEQFVTMVQKNAEHQAIESAVEAGDYTAFKNAIIAQIPSEAEFQKMVIAHKARTETRTKIESAVKNNDFAAFKLAIQEQKTNMIDHHPEMDTDAPKALSDEKLQKHFDTLVEYYKTNGKFPEMGKGFGPAGKGMGGHGIRGESRRGE